MVAVQPTGRRQAAGGTKNDNPCECCNWKSAQNDLHETEKDNKRFLIACH